MTWSLNASGHTPPVEGESGWKKVEEKLFAELQSVLAKPEYGTSSSHFGGNHVQGNPHTGSAMDSTGHEVAADPHEVADPVQI